MTSFTSANLIFSCLRWLTGTTDSTEFAEINVSASGDNEVIPPAPGKRILVLGYAFSAVLAVFVQMKDKGAGTRASFDMTAGGRAEFAGSVWCPAFKTDVGKGVDFNLSLGTGVRGHITYMKV